MARRFSLMSLFLSDTRIVQLQHEVHGINRPWLPACPNMLLIVINWKRTFSSTSWQNSPHELKHLVRLKNATHMTEPTECKDLWCWLNTTLSTRCEQMAEKMYSSRKQKHPALRFLKFVSFSRLRRASWPPWPLYNILGRHTTSSHISVNSRPVLHHSAKQQTLVHRKTKI